MEITESIKDLFEPELMEEILAVGKKKTAKSIDDAARRA